MLFTWRHAPFQGVTWWNAPSYVFHMWTVDDFSVKVFNSETVELCEESAHWSEMWIFCSLSLVLNRLCCNKKIDEIDDGWNKNSSQSCTRSISLTQSRRPSFSVSVLLVLFFCVRSSQGGCVPILSVLWQRQNTPATQSSAADNSTKNSLQSLNFYFSLSFSLSLSVCLQLNSSVSARAQATQINL